MIGFERLPKKAVKTDILDNAVEAFEKKQVISVTVPAKKRGRKPASSDDVHYPREPKPKQDSSASITFKMNKSLPLETLSHFQAWIIQTAIAIEENTGIIGIDYMRLKSGIHMYIFENLTSLPVPMTTDEEGGQIIDAQRVISYGEYLRSECIVYAELWSSLIIEGEKFCTEYINSANQMTATLLGNKSAINNVLNNPDILNAFIDRIRDGSDFT